MTGPMDEQAAEADPSVVLGDVVPAAREGSSANAWAIVISRARHRCQCKTCPPCRRGPGGRCMAETGGGFRLIAAPPHPGARPEREPVETDPDKLVAWCPPCYDAAVKRARKVVADALAHAMHDSQESLF